MFGYFLKSAISRHHLELNLMLAEVDLPLGHRIQLPQAEFLSCGPDNLAIAGHLMDTVGISSLYQGSDRGRNTNELRRYVMGFDPEKLQRCAKLKSREAVNLVERYSRALFGDDEMGVIEDDKGVAVSFSSLKRLVLEAVAFGSFLRDVGRYVDSFYKLKEN